MTLDEAYKLKGLAITERELAEIKLKQANEVIINFINGQNNQNVVPIDVKSNVT